MISSWPNTANLSLKTRFFVYWLKIIGINKYKMIMCLYNYLDIVAKIRSLSKEEQPKTWCT
jgi:hypothetical protein